MSLKIKKVLILGGGTMGQQIGLQCAVSGFDVTIYDINEDFIKKAEERLPRLAKKVADSGRFSHEAAKQGVKRVKFTTDPETAGKDADIINESVPEDPKLKGKVFAQFNEICPEHTIFTTNTSTLVPSMFADASGRPEKVCALHFHDLQLTNVVDIMPHPKTSEETLEIVRQFTKDIDHYAIELKKEYHGYVFNNMLSTLFSTALTLASREVASYEDIDKAWMGVLKAPIGPFGMMDSVGLETVWKITDYWANTLNDKQSKKNAEFLKKFVDDGNLGIKTRKGFYEYPDAAYFKPEFLKGVK
jgi:3-hydroxybutyryl-CoA dehydrogenase